MVDTYGRWTEEKDYSTYPKEKWCDYDYMAAWIREQGYEPKTDMENLISNIFCFYEIEIGDHVSEYDTENGNFDGTDKSFVDAVEEITTNFDIDEEVEIWIPLRGQNGVPSSISALIHDAEWKLEQLESLVCDLQRGKVS